MRSTVDGSIQLLTPIHPLFLCISFLRNANCSNYMSIEDLFISSTFPAIHDLGKLPVVAQQLHNICDVQLVGEEEYYRYSPSLCVSWLKTRVERASKSRALLLFRSSREGSFSHRCSPSHFVVHQQGLAAGDLQRVLSGAVAAGAQVCCGEGV